MWYVGMYPMEEPAGGDSVDEDLSVRDVPQPPFTYSSRVQHLQRICHIWEADERYHWFGSLIKEHKRCVHTQNVSMRVK